MSSIPAACTATFEIASLARARSWQALGLLVVLGLVGCQQPEPSFQVERSRSYQQDKMVVWDKILQFLQANDIRVRQSDLTRGTIEAERLHYQDAGWAYCKLAIGTDRSGNTSRPRRARQRIDRDLSLAITVSEVDATTDVMLDTRFTERQVHPWRNLPFTTGCVSKGVLEKALLDAV
ncbi:MAG TPA: hypothetical protein VFV80_00100 [Geminicoccaceae bacterium]|nr:hypothetical protein [Geminicoccaceae bacterium]